MPALSKRSPIKKKLASPKLQVLKAGNLQKLPWLIHGFSTRPNGLSTCYGGKALNLGFTKDDLPERVERNRTSLLLALNAANGKKSWPLITLRQVHSDLIHVVRSQPDQPLAGNGLITNLPNIALAIQTADCFPILLVDPKHKAVGAFHAGWRGTLRRIVEKGLGLMRCEYGTLPKDVYAAIGPGIGKCCYEVSEELKEQFDSQFAWSHELFHEVQESDAVREKYPMLFLNKRAPGHGDMVIKLFLDLQEANRRQLMSAGVPEKQITSLGECTSCHPKRFFSHRAEKGKAGRMLAVIGVKNPPQAAS